MIKEILQTIKQHRNFLITTHIKLEGDALGSVLSLRDILLYLKKKADIVVQDRIPCEYKFLPHIQYIKNVKEVNFSDYEVLFALDTSSQQRCLKVIKSFGKDKIIVNIDHHISNTCFGSINWIDPEASSTTEMLYRLYQRLNIPLDKLRATWLYVGILTDTGSFRYPNTNAKTFQLAGRLVNYGLDVNRIYQSIYYNFTLKQIRMLNQIISTLKSDRSGRIVWFKMSRDFPDNTYELSDEILDLGRMIKQAEVVVLFRENPYQRGNIRVNLRSKGRVDVDMIARIFGGGGHHTASGFSIKETLTRAEKIVIGKIKQILKGCQKE